MILQDIFQNNFEIIIPEFFLTIIILTILLFNTFFIQTKNNQKILIINISNNLLIYTLFLNLTLLFYIPNSYVSILNGIFINDIFSIFLKILLIFLVIIFFLIQQSYIINQKILNFENSILILISVLGLMFLISTYNLITLYIAIELQSLCFYILAASKKKSYFSIEASLKYFILGSIASSFILLGASLIYGSLGTLNLGNVFLIISNLNFINHLPLLLNISGSFLIIILGFFFKIGCAPFHIWLPDVYEGSPNNITAFFSIIPKPIIIGLLMKLLFDIFNNIFSFLEIFFFLSAFLSIFVGSFSALKQKNLKRLLAYSSIGHSGFILIGLSINTFESSFYVLFYILTYIIMTLNIWSIILTIYLNKKPIKYLSDLTNFFKLNNILSFIILLNFFSMAGIPPLMGFFSKFFIIKIAIYSNLKTLSILSILLSILSAFYYIRIIKIIFFDNKKNYLILNKIKKSNSIICILTTKFLILFFLIPEYLIIFIKKIILLTFI